MASLRDVMGLPPRQMGTTEDVARSVVSEGSKGVADLAGGMGDMHNNIRGVAAWAMQKLGADEKTANKIGYAVATGTMPLSAFMPDSKTTRSVIPDSWEHEAQTSAGDIAGRIAYGAPSTLAMPAGSLANKALSLVGSSVGGFAGREGSEKIIDALENWVPKYKDTIEEYRPYIEGGADLVGSVGGSFAPSVVQRAVTPNPMTDERLADARTLDRHGVEMTAGQRTGNEALHYAESQTGGPAYWNMRQRQNRQYTAGALDDAGVGPQRPGAPRPDVASPEVLNRQHAQLGTEFDRLQGYGMNPDTQFFDDLVQIRDDYRATMPQHNRAPIVETTIRQLADRARRGIPVDGELLRKTGTQLRRTRQQYRASGRADDAEAIDNLIEAIDGGLERSLAATNPNEVGRFQDVRRLYRNLITVEEAASNAPNGQLSPADLTRATKKMETRKGYSRGFGPFNNYSRAGAEILSEKPNSGTASRLVAALGGGGKSITAATIGGGIGAMINGIPGAGMGAALGAGADMMVKLGKNYIRMTPPMQAYLANQLARGWEPGIGSGTRAGVAGVNSVNRSKEKY